MTRQGTTSLRKVRVIGIFAHVDAGKTTTSEGVLYHTGRIRRMGSVDEGSAQLDWMAQERERGITVTAAATTVDWRGHRIHLIDTPGHIDFSAEVVRSIRVIDGAVIVLCGVGGVEPQTETVWLHAEREKLPRVLFVNKLDRRGADFDGVLATARERLTPHAVALQVPIDRADEFRGVVDLLSVQALVWREGAEAPAVEPVPAAMEREVASARAALVDAICETDDGLLEHRLEGREPGEAALRAALRRATLRGWLVPVVCGSALRRIGIQPLLDAVAGCLPSPLDVPEADPAAPLCAAAFKIVTDPYVGHLTWVRVFSGRLDAGERVYNPRAHVEERVSRIYRMHANKREEVDHMAASDVVALVGVKSAITGDTLCDPEHPVQLEAFAFPEPVILVALPPASDEGRDKLRHAVQRLCNEDPTLVAGFDPETGEETLAGMGELHLEVAVDRLRTEFGLLPRTSPPRIAYRETVRRPMVATATYRKQSGGRGHYAQVRLRVEPLERGVGVVFESRAAEAKGPSGLTRARHPYIPPGYIRPIERGIREALAKGAVAGYPVTDLRVTLLGGKVHTVDSSGMDFHIAGSMAVRRAVRSARPALLEPLMQLDVTVGEERLGAVVADLGRRRGRVKAMEPRGRVHAVTGEVPLAEARGYATDLRSLTRGRATFTLEFRRYDLVPDALAEAIIAQRRADGKIPAR